ncbi:hypothetical protein HLB44_19325 [Aquincola sp. S2]|uniref:DUF3726 domain-containing protein n=1 Tax=Pseudaquabacterium terrae TaxID=2732868 RepID=A0ABX2EKM9_9BURK|nr:hypothetical protein [Aquabacterium terrae]NRF69151.1 hypothetical protein [Aquabacterium terrae]
MSRWRREWRTLGLGSDALVGSANAEFTVLARPGMPGAWTEDELLAALQAALAPRPSLAGLRVAVAPELCRHWVHQPAGGLRSFGELRQTAEIRCGRLFGTGATDGWSVVADWGLDRPFVCAALPVTLVNALRHAGRVLKVPLRIESAVLIALARLGVLLDRPGWLVWHTPSSIVLARGDGQRLTALRCARHGLPRDDERLRERLMAELRHERLTLGLADDEPVLLPSCDDAARSAWARALWPAAGPGAASDAAWACTAASG